MQTDDIYRDNSEDWMYGEGQGRKRVSEGRVRRIWEGQLLRAFQVHRGVREIPRSQASNDSSKCLTIANV